VDCIDPEEYALSRPPEKGTLLRTRIAEAADRATNVAEPAKSLEFAFIGSLSIETGFHDAQR
jgi:hypothetical protein